jgi:tetratricopeptide (TPR) repeat protein
VARIWLGTGGTAEALEAANRFRGGLPDRERLLIEAIQNAGAAREVALREYLLRYENEKIAWFMLGDRLFHSYRIREGLSYIEKALEIDPSFIFGWEHIVDYHMWIANSGARARSHTEEALRRGPDNVVFRQTKAILAADDGDVEEALDQLSRLEESLASDPNNMRYLTTRLYITYLRDDFRGYEEVVQTWIDEGRPYQNSVTYYEGGWSTLRGKQQPLIGRATEVIESSESPPALYEAGLFLLLMGEAESAGTAAGKIQRAAAEREPPLLEMTTLGQHLAFLHALSVEDVTAAGTHLDSLRQLTLGRDNEYGFLYYDAAGRMATRQADYARARQNFQQAVLEPTSLPSPGIPFPFNPLIIEGYVDCLMKDEAYQDVIRILDLPNYRWLWDAGTPAGGTLHVRLRLVQAQALEAAGRLDEAREAYQYLALLWRDADPGFGPGSAAQEALARLSGGPPGH